VEARERSLRRLLANLCPSARDKLRTVLIRDDRDESAALLLRYGDANGDGWADVVDATVGSQRHVLPRALDRSPTPTRSNLGA
jgi:hypothetical protein